jgi:hypothetical protein
MATGRLPDPNTAPVTAKGDLYTYSTVPAKLTVGSNGDTLVADSAATTGLRWSGNYAAGKNKIINGDFNINQRGFTSATAINTFTFDRFDFSGASFTSGLTVSAQTFTPGTAPISGYEATNYLRMVTSLVGAGTSTQIYLRHKIEDVRTFAGQTATISFWAKANSGTPNIGVRYGQNFGSGGSSSVFGIAGSITPISTSWARYSFTVAIPSISGKTIGSSSFLELRFYISAGASVADVGAIGNQDNTFEFWGIQAEAGSVATAFQTATGTLQGELAACQRYYFRNANGASTGVFASGGVAFSTTAGIVPVVMPVPMRITPTTLDTTGTAANYRLYNGSINLALNAVPTIGAGDSTANVVMLNVGVVSGLSAGTNFQLSANTSTTAYLGFGAEL